jgi:DNA-binding IclR family transcriptional regulator
MASQPKDPAIAAPSRYRERNSTADRALDILSMFTEQRLAISAAEVAAELDVARSTAYRYLQSLVGSDFLEEAGGGRFLLGRRILELARLARRGVGLSETARPAMRRLAAEVGETVLLTRLAGSAVICLEREEAERQTVRISYERGQILPMNAGASAFVLLAWLDAAELTALLAATALDPITPATITTEAGLRKRLAQTSAQGYGVSRGELDPDVLGVAAPIRDARDRVVAALSVAAVATRVPAHRMPELVNAVRAAADEISQTLSLVG